MSEPRQLPVEIQSEVPAERAVGVHADVANIWHTPSTFVLDFLALVAPPQPVPPGSSDPDRMQLNAQLASRVRIPADQIFPLITALTEQGQQWLAESGRSEAPESWFRHDGGTSN